jgi:hypothetical protein
MYTGHRLDFQSSKPATRAGFYVSEGRIMGQRLIRISRGMASGFPAAGGFSPPFAPQNLTLTNQGGAVNTNTSTQQIAWDVAVAGTFPVSSYNVYRNGSFLANTAALSYSDTTATNSIQENTFAPSTPYVYSVSAVDTHSNEGAQQTQCYAWWYRWGVANQSETQFSYGGITLNWADTVGAPPQGAFDISNVYGAAGGFQPVANNPLCPLYGMELGWAKFMLADVKLGDATHTWNLLNLSRPGYGSAGGGADIQPVLSFPIITNTSSPYGSPSTSGWATLKIPLTDMAIGVTQFMGYATGTTVTMTSLISGPGVDEGAYITGSGMPAGTYVSVQPGSLSGPWTVNQATGTLGSVGSPVQFTATRTALYKPNFFTNTGGSTIYWNNIGFCVN